MHVLYIYCLFLCYARFVIITIRKKLCVLTVWTFFCNWLNNKKYLVYLLFSNISQNTILWYAYNRTHSHTDRYSVINMLAQKPYPKCTHTISHTCICGTRVCVCFYACVCGKQHTPNRPYDSIQCARSLSLVLSFSLLLSVSISFLFFLRFILRLRFLFYCICLPIAVKMSLLRWSMMCEHVHEMKILLKSTAHGSIDQKCI